MTSTLSFEDVFRKLSLIEEHKEYLEDPIIRDYALKNISENPERCTAFINMFQDQPRTAVNVLKMWYNEDRRVQQKEPAGISGPGPNAKTSLTRIHAAWNQPYRGTTDAVLTELIRIESAEFEKTNHPYAKMMPVTQSSGAGKSRLIDQFSQKHLGVVYTFRLENQTGYPPSDVEITSLVQEALIPILDQSKQRMCTQEHSTAVALIGSTCLTSTFDS